MNTILLMLIQYGLCQQLKIKDLKTDPLLILEVKTCKIQIGTMKIIHPINITMIEKTIDELHTSLLQKIEPSSSFYNMIKFKIYNMYSTIKQLKPRRFRRWDTIGTVWKWIAGSEYYSIGTLRNGPQISLLWTEPQHFRSLSTLQHITKP